MDGQVAWTSSWFGHGCTGQWMGWRHGRYHGLGMDALACGWASSMDVIMVWAWMHWPMDGLVAWTGSWFGPRLGMDGARIRVYVRASEGHGGTDRKGQSEAENPASLDLKCYTLRPNPKPYSLNRKR